MLFSRKISILAICTLIATIPATSFADEKIKVPEVGTIDMPSKATSNAGSPTTVLSRHYIDRLHVNGAQISNEDINVANNLRFYGESSTAAATTQKEVSIPSITKLEAGQIIAVKPTETATKANDTLKLNDFAAYPMRYRNSAITTSTDSIVWYANTVSFFVFDGSYWHFAGGGSDNTSYSTMTQTNIDENNTGVRVVAASLLNANYQKKNTVDHYSVNKNGTWLDASAAITADETYLTETANDTDGSTQIGIKTANLANAGTNITGLTDSSAAADKGKLTTAYAVKEAITSATSGMITDVSGKQDKDNNQIYKVGYNGGWENAYNAIGVDTTYLKKTDNSTNGTTQVAVDSSKLASAGTGITSLTDSSAAADKGKLTTAYAVKEAITSATSGMITDVSGKQDKDNNQIYKVGYNGGWENAYNAIGVDTTYLKKTDNSTTGATEVAVDSTKLASAKANITDLTSSSTDANKGKLTTAYAVKQGLDDKQDKDTTTKYKVSQNGAWVNASNAVTVDTTYLKKTDNSTTGATQVAVDSSKLASAGTGITGLTDSSAAADKGKLTTAYAVKEAITSATSGMITDVSGKQDKDNNQIYKVGYNGGWENAYNAIGVDTTYLKKTDNSTNGTTQVAVDSSKLASAKADITDLTSSSTSANKGKLTTAYAVKTALDDKQAKDTTSKYMIGQNGSWVNASNAVTVDTTYLKKTDNSTTGATQVAVDSTKLASAMGNITTLTNSSTDADKGKLTTAWAVNQAIDNDINRFAKSHFVNAAPLLNENSVYWGMSHTSDSTAAKTVTIDSLDPGSINTGVFVIITPKATTNVPISTLNVNDSGAFPISYNGSTTISAADSGKIWKAGVPSMFVFDVNREWAYVGSDTDTTYTQGSGITISGTTINNAGVRDIKNPDNTTASTTIADGTIRANINGTVRYPLVRGWNKTVKYDGTNAVGSATKGVYVNASGVVTEMTHSVNADVPSTAVFTDTVTTVKNSDGTDGASTAADGSVQVTKDGTTTYPVVQGWSTMATNVSNKQNKPNKSGETTAAAGKVLTYTSDSLDNNVAARYIQVPVATGDPNDGGTVNSTTPLASIWVE